ncbi:hypothetical protein FDC06_15000 [Clostridium botulinum]|uniref:Membrane protein n=1 Tax=Clostridium botulinum (strain Hall / ATCC 3502 / NCTC 13319 / Type A) TaxID=441771 RepID=A5I654_CLOBH|nr:hypothetical protein DB732_15190 [Clostridium botulinum]CAL84536.1 putative membrane protein [Clostridium botulinum A str. ATCC 3502]AWB31602.1 hypothetical protein DBN47_15485 [Clostridium botulinum]EGT5616223.1 hypothetical protein [Clostridium botulinum]EGT5621276.1 hypothetical protein [Clostridium botulinum]
MFNTSSFSIFNYGIFILIAIMVILMKRRFLLMEGITTS